jgi:DNA polymerase I
MQEILEWLENQTELGLSIDTYSDKKKKEETFNPLKTNIRLITIGNDSNQFTFDMNFTHIKTLEVIFKEVYKKNLIIYDAQFVLLSLFFNYNLELPDNFICLKQLEILFNNSNFIYLKEYNVLNCIRVYLKNNQNVIDEPFDWSMYQINKTQIENSKRKVKLYQPLLKEIVFHVNNLSNNKTQTHWTGIDTFVGNLEIEFTKNLINIIKQGIPFNKDSLLKLKYDLDMFDSNVNLKHPVNKNNYKYQFNQKYNVNPDSFLQIKQYLNSKGIDRNTFDSDSIDDLINIYYNNDIKNILPFLYDLKKYRNGVSERNFLYEIIENINDNKIHPSFTQQVNTGRLSCSIPNTQKIPRIYKSLFYDNSFLIKKTFDYPAIELRILSCFLYQNYQDDRMLQSFINKGLTDVPLDIHILTASDIYNIPYEQINNNQRQLGKAVNFGFSYGIGVQKFQNSLKDYGLDLDLDTCSLIKKTFLDKNYGIKMWHNSSWEILNEIKENNIIFNKNYYKVSTLSGRVLSANSFNNLLNYPIQGTGADILKYAINIFCKRIKENDINCSIVNIVHDEIIYCNNDENVSNLEIDYLLKKSMEDSINSILVYLKTDLN